MHRIFQTHRQYTHATIASWLLLFAIFLWPQWASAQVVWNATDWTTYDTITIDSSNIDDDLTDFPVYVDLADLSSIFWSTTPSGVSTVATDIRITTDDMLPTELPREIVFASSTAETGELHFKANSISSTTDTVFRIYYNGTTTGDYAIDATNGAENVWTNEYQAVYHMNETTSFLDSTSNDRDGTVNGSISSGSGRVGTGHDYANSTSDYVTLPEDFVIDSVDHTIQFWFNADAVGDDVPFSLLAQELYFLTFGDGGATDELSLRFSDGSFTNVISQTSVSTSDVWYHWAHTFENSSGDYVLYTDGSQSDTGTNAGGYFDSSSGSSTVGLLDNGFIDRAFDGQIDELRISSTTRSAAWIAAEHSNQATTTDFYTAVLGNGVAWNDTDWTTYDTITIDSSNIDDDLTDFPVYVDLADLSSTFWSTTPSGASVVGTDIRVTTNDGSPVELPRELVAASSTAQTGELHFKANSISSTTDTVFRIYYNGTTTGDYAVDATYGAENVWTNDFVLVYHMDATSPTDVTAGTKDGTATGDSLSTVTGFLGTGVDIVDDGGNDYINIGDNLDELTGLSGMSVSAWVNIDDDSNDDSFFTRKLSTGGEPILLWDNISGDNNDTYTFNVGSTATGGNRVDGASNAAIGGQWQLVTATMDGSERNVYVDGSLSRSVDSGGISTIPANTGGSGIGYWAGSANFDFDGIIDEFRLSSTTRSAAWIAAEHSNQATTTDFYTAVLGNGVAWNDTDWTTYDTITIDSSNIDDDLTDFPVYVDLADLSSTFWSTTPSGASVVGTDIRVTTNDGSPVELPRELVAASSTAQTGELHFKANSISSTTDTVFRIYYNGTTTGDYAVDATYGAENVWSNYTVVWHMNELEQSDSAGNIPDRSIEGNFTDPSLDADGNIIFASNDELDVASADEGAGALEGFYTDWTSMAFWDQDDSITTTAGSVAVAVAGFGEFHVTNIDTSTGNVLFRSGSEGTVTTTDGPSGTGEHLLVATYDSGSDTISLYVNGTLATSSSEGNSPTNEWDGWQVYRLFGTHYESRGAQEAKSAEYIKAQYINFATTTDFYTAAAVSTVAGLTISGTVYQSDGTTPITTGLTIAAAVGTSTPSVHTTTSDGSGNFSITGIATSTVGVLATSSSYANSDWQGITYGNGRFVAVGTGFSEYIMYSSDGISWTDTSFSGSLRGVTYGNGTFVSVGFGRAAYSTNGVSWTNASSIASNDWRDVAYGNGLFVAVSGDGRTMYSSDGISWTDADVAGGDDEWTDITYGNDLFVAVANDDTGSDRVMTSSDGIVWSTRSAAGNNDDWESVTYGNGLYVAVGSCIAGGDCVMTSSDGISWTAQNAAGDNDSWAGVTYGNGLFVAVGTGVGRDGIMYSSDGISWTVLVDSTVSGQWSGVAYGHGLFAVTGVFTDEVGYVLAGLGDSTPITLFIDNETEDATTITYGLNNQSGVTTLANVDLYQDTLILDNATGTQIVDLGRADFYDSDTDVDILFDSDIGSATVTGDLLVSSDTTLVAPQVLDLGDNLTISGTFEHEQGEVQLTGGNQTLTTTATTTFYTFTADATSARSLTFTSGEEYVFLATSSITGASGQLTSVVASTPATQYFFTPHTSFTTTYLDVTDAHNLSATTTSISCVTGCVNGGNNTNWIFAPDSLTISGTVYQSDGTTPITTGLTIAAAVGTSTPSVHTTTSDGSGNFSITGIATSTVGSWNAVTAAGDNDGWESVTYGVGRYVAVGRTGTDRVMTSEDGLTWSARSAVGNNDTWRAVTYGNGRFVAVGEFPNDVVMTSTDGITWATTTAAEDDDYWTDITYGNGRFVAVSRLGDDRVMTSEDGLTWTARSAAGDNDEWESVTYGNGRFVAVGDSGDRIMTSSDGITWTVQNGAGDNDQWNGITYGNGLFVAVGDDASSADDLVMTSSDGITWATTTVAGDNDDWSSVTYGNGLFVAVSIEVNGADDLVMTSSDGITWATTTVAGDNDDWTDVTYGNGLFVAVSSFGDRVIYADAGLGDSTPITLFIDNETEDATTITYGLNNQSGVTTLANVDLYQDTLRFQHSTTSGDFVLSDGSFETFLDDEYDADILFNATSSATSTFTAAVEIAANTTIYPRSTTIFEDNLTISGTFEHEQGEVQLTGGNQTLTTTATTTFYTFTADATSARSLTFTSGEEYVFLATSSITGASGQLTSVAASTPGLEFFVTPHATLTVDYLNVSDAHNISATTTPILCTVTCVDGGNTSGWSLPVGAVAPWSAATYTTYDTITIDSSNIDDDLTDFPVYVDLADLSSTFWSTTPSGASVVGTDIRVTTNDGSPVELPRELVAASSTAQTGELHFKANSISSTTDTVFRIYYNGTTTGDYAVDATYGAQNVWVDNYLAVYHDGGSTDSTSFARTAAGINGAVEGGATGQVGAGAELNGTTQGFQTSSVSEIDDLTQVTVSTWFKPDALSTNRGIYSLNTTGVLTNSDDYTRARLDSSGIASGRSSVLKVGVRNEAGSFQNVETAANDYSTDWTMMHQTWTDGSNLEVFVNGTNTVDREYTGTALSGSTLEASQLTIGGGGQSSSGGYFDGVMDEFRIASTSLSDAWIIAEYENQSSTTVFYTVAGGITLNGTATIANHDVGQTSNAFNTSDKTNETLFTFKVTPNSGAATATVVRLDITGARNITEGVFSNMRLLQDLDADGNYDLSDTVLSSSGVIDLSHQTGSISFAINAGITAATNYIVVTDWDNLLPGAQLTLNLNQDGITVTDTNGTVIISGAVTSIQHARSSGGGGSSAQIGDAPPAGDGDIGGGGGSGGEQIGNDPDFFWPTADSGDWTNSANAYDQVDGTYATVAGLTNHSYTDYEHGVPSGDDVLGIEVKVESRTTGIPGLLSAQLSWDGGSSFTSSKTVSSGTTDTVATLGSSTDLWGRTWTAAELSDANFAVRFSYTSGNNMLVDAIQVKIHHQASGGGAGGGGAI